MAVFRASEAERIEAVWLRPAGPLAGSPGVAAWRHHDASETSDRLLIWHGGVRRLVSGGREDLVAGATTPDGRHQLFTVQPSQIGIATGPLVVVLPSWRAWARIGGVRGADGPDRRRGWLLARRGLDVLAY